MKKVSKIKRFLSLALIFLLSINSFAASVNNNDGSAFITKAEFDALKSNFQAQIDTYNQGIDSKIDNAIASYLSGIRISNEFQRDNISYSEEGVANINKDEFKYSKGNMKWFAKNYDVRWNNTSIKYHCGIFFAEIWFAKTPTEFKEMLINHVDYTATVGAEWIGYAQTLQEFDTTLSAVTESGYGNSTNYGYLGFVENPPQVSTKDSMLGQYLFWMGASYANTAPTTNSTSYTNSFNMIPKYATFLRTIVKNHFSQAILTVNSLVETRFSNNDGLHDFWNDDWTATDYWTYHAKPTSTTQIVEEVTVDSHVASRDGDSTAYKQKQTDLVVHPYLLKHSTHNSDYLTKPYAGFDKKIQNYNKLWTSRYDSYLSDMTSSCGSINNSLIQGHLALYAGAPICDIKKDESVLIPLEFEDKTKDYDVWIKTSPFRNYNPWDTTNEICVNPDKMYTDKTKGTKVTAGSLAQSLKIINGSGNAYFTAESDGYIFIKFAESGKNGLGSAHYKPDKTVTIFSNND